MSAKVVDFAPDMLPPSATVGHRGANVEDANPSIVNRIRFEIVYQLYFAPEPTREQLAMEAFLLDCD